jgi:hypothetical protein
LKHFGGKAAFHRQRVEDNAFHLQASLKVDRLLPWLAVASAKAAEDDAKNSPQAQYS